jgi:hypothetical protein
MVPFVGRLVALISALVTISMTMAATAGAGAPPPEVKEIFEPSLNGAPLNPADVHMEAEYHDADDDSHYCTDWQIWDVEAEEQVWDVETSSASPTSRSAPTSISATASSSGPTLGAPPSSSRPTTS